MSETIVINRAVVDDVVATKSVVDDFEDKDHASVIEADDEQHRQQCRIQVSSRHLVLTSAVFRGLLHVGFREGGRLSSQGYTELLLPDDDPAALLVLLNLIHGHFRKVPRTVDLPLFTEIAILIDKYELLETTELVADHWFKGLVDEIPWYLNETLLAWMCISWILKKPDIFKEVTRVAQLESGGRLEVDCLPIPQSVLGLFKVRVRTTKY